MQITLPARSDAPECELHIEILQRDPSKQIGKYRPVMMLLPGGPGGNYTIYNQIKFKLFEYADIILVDPRGCGLSTPSHIKYCTMEQAVSDIEALRKQLRLGQFILFGGSYGAMVSLCYAVKYSVCLTALILVAGAPSGKFIKTAIKNLEIFGDETQIELGKKVLSGNVESLEELGRYYQVVARMQLPQTIQKSAPPYFLDLLNFGFSTMLPKYDVSAELYKIKCPTLLLAGKNDWVNDVKFAFEMQEGIPNSQLVIFPDSSHLVWHGSENEFFNALCVFLKNI